jgi:hypothetical protein
MELNSQRLLEGKCLAATPSLIALIEPGILQRTRAHHLLNQQLVQDVNGAQSPSVLMIGLQPAI